MLCPILVCLVKKKLWILKLYIFQAVALPPQPNRYKVGVVANQLYQLNKDNDNEVNTRHNLVLPIFPCLAQVTNVWYVCSYCFGMEFMTLNQNQQLLPICKILNFHKNKIILFDFPLSLASFLCFRRCSLTCKEKSGNVNLKLSVVFPKSVNARSLTIRSTRMSIEPCFRPKDKRISSSNRCRVAVSLNNPDYRYSCTIKLKLNFPNSYTRTLILRFLGDL